MSNPILLPVDNGLNYFPSYANCTQYWFIGFYVIPPDSFHYPFLLCQTHVSPEEFLPPAIIILLITGLSHFERNYYLSVEIIDPSVSA